MLLFFNSLTHFFVDALCITTLFSAGLEGEASFLAVVAYNTLAFSTQCLVGLLTDHVKRPLSFELGAMAAVILGFALPLPAFVRIALVSQGNSFFHVAAGTMTLEDSRGQARALGIFVAPGAFGVTLGSCFPSFGWPLAAGLLLCGAAVAYFYPRRPATLEYRVESERGLPRFPLCAVLLLTAAVAIRALGGSAVSFPWKTGAGAAFLMTGFVFAGKVLGGFLCDRLKPGRTALISLLPAAVCIAFFADYALPSLIGQLLLNLTMPVTLWLMFEAMPEAPGFAFGLAASALWPGTIAGMLLQLSGPALRVCELGTILFGLAAILLSEKQIHQIKGELLT